MSVQSAETRFDRSGYNLVRQGNDIVVPATQVETSERNTIETPGYQHRVLFLGGNGSGKTIVASKLITPYPRVVILDVKYDFPVPPDWEESGDYQIRNKPPNIGLLNSLQWRWGSSRIIYRPTPPYDTGENVTAFLNSMFDRARKVGKSEPFILYVDEGGWTAYNGSRLAMARIAISGRSLGLGFWVSAQRPRGIPVEVRSEAWETFVFFLKYREDRKEIVAYLDEEIDERDLESTANDYEFLLIQRGKGGKYSYRRYPPVKISA